MSDYSKVDPSSHNITGEKKKQLEQIFPEAFADGKLNVDKLKQVLGEDVFVKDEHYELSWAGKSETYKVLQQPTTATLAPVPDESVNFNDTENVFIEGENLEVLKILQKSYFGKIKMIYIDPPYNTGNDSFIYPDKFSETKDEYLKRIGSKDEEGYLTKDGFFRKNSKDSGYYHSNWLSMMYPRLYLARNLLKDDGVIFVSIDDNEVHNLRAIMNEIFGEENFISCLIWKSRQNKDNRNITGVSIDHEYILCYGKRLRGSERDKSQYSNPDNDPRGEWTSANMVGLLPQDKRPNCHYDLIDPESGINYGKPKLGWRYDKNTMNKLIDEKKIIWPSSKEGRPRRKKFLSELQDEYTGYSSIVAEDIYTRDGTSDIEKVFDFRAMEFPKPVDLLKEFILQGDIENELTLDFFTGSATVSQSIIELNKEDSGNRRFICVQLPEKTDEDSEAYKAGYKTIAEIGKERIRRVIKQIEKEKADKPDMFENGNLDLGFKIFKLRHSNFKLWRGDVLENENDLENQIDVFANNVIEDTKEHNILYELMLKSGYLLTDKVEEKNGYYSVKENELIIVTNKADQETIDEIIKSKPAKVIILDELFEDNDQLKTNTALQMKDAGIEFRTV